MKHTWTECGLRSQPIREEDRSPSTNDRAGFEMRYAWGCEYADWQKKEKNVEKRQKKEKKTEFTRVTSRIASCAYGQSNQDMISMILCYSTLDRRKNNFGGKSLKN